ncbi:MAG: hypothetical protein IPK60_02765 [Sandaracinaceae bacterium]|nr:hypothetical protein [Sandaracinaceae bacterium]
MRFDLPPSVKARFASLSKDQIADLSDSVDTKTGCMLLSPVQFYDTREIEDPRLASYRGVVIGEDLDGNVFMLLANEADPSRLEDAVYFFESESGRVFLVAKTFKAFCDDGMMPVAAWKEAVVSGGAAADDADDDDGHAEARRSVARWIAEELVIMKDEALGPTLLADFLVHAADSQSSPEATLAELVDLVYVDEVFLDEQAVSVVLHTIA